MFILSLPSPDIPELKIEDLLKSLRFVILFGILNFGHCDLFGICVLCFVI